MSDIAQNGFKKIFLWFSKNWIYLTGLFFLVIISFANGLNGELVSDDVYAIKDMEYMFRSPQYIFETPSFVARSILYYIAYQMGGINPLYYRLFNIFFHISVVFLVYALIPFFSKKKMLAFMVSAFTAVHPIMVESVTWISGGIYSQSVFFMLFSFYLYLHYRENHRLMYYISSLVSFLLALSPSEKVIVFPFVLVLYEFIFGSVKKNWKLLISYFGISFLWGLMLIPRIAPRIAFIEADSGFVVQPINPLIQIPVVIYTYFKLLFWPVALTLYHSEFALTFLDVFIAYTALFVIIGTGIYFFKKNKLLFFWLAFFFITLSPTLTPFGISALVAERYAYASSIGIYFIVAWYFLKLIEHKKYDIGGYILFFAIILILIVRTMVRNHDWKTADNLWKATAQVSPNNPKSLNNVAQQYIDEGNVEKAIEELEKAIALNPNFPHAYHNLAHIYQRYGRHQEAIMYYSKALELNPNLWQAHSNVSEVYIHLGQYEKALEHLQNADKINPNSPNIYHNIGHVYQKMNNFDKAMEYYDKVLALNPKFIQTYENLGVVYFSVKDYQKSIEYFEKAIELAPENSKLYASLGIVYLRSGNTQMAEASFKKSLSINPEESLAQSGLKELKR